MSVDRASWPAAARALAQQVEAAVGSAQAGDRAAFGDAVDALHGLDPNQVATLLGGVLREVLERTHPDGLDSDDAEAALERCLGAVRPWYPDVDEDHLVRALAGALGIADPDETGVADARAVLAHGLLLISDLLTATGQRPGPVLDDSMQELVRAQTVELP